MEGFIFGGMGVLVLLIISGLLLVGGRALARANAGLGPDDLAVWPRVAVIVPVAGAAADLTANLKSLLCQDYPHYQVILVTKDQEDPATPVIAKLIPEYPHARLIISGPAVSCGQKNHNLLAGIKAAGEAPEVLAFCDSTRLASVSWLKGMVLPLIRGETVVSGYHHVLPKDQVLAAWGRAITVLVLFLVKGISVINQPWGGATAISRRVFEELQVGRLWATNVVDDVSMGVLLQEKGLRVGMALGESLITPISGETLSTWQDWLIRQLLYLKFCFPGTWLAVGLLLYLLAVMVLLSGLMPLATLLGFSMLPIWPGLVFLAALTGLSTALKNLHPQPPSLHKWIPAFYAVIFMAAWCHLRNWGVREIHWRGISYRVGWKGRVVGIRKG
jgi:ceramide glucosyltransferase